jgi:hypothetical protein
MENGSPEILTGDAGVRASGAYGRTWLGSSHHVVRLFPFLRCIFRWELPIYNMHRFFLVEELVSAVLQFLGQDGQGSLAAVAYSCRALSDMALDELWVEAEFWDLAKTMRADLWEVTHERHMPRGDWALHATQDVWTLVSRSPADSGPLIIRFAEAGRRRQHGSSSGLGSAICGLRPAHEEAAFQPCREAISGRPTQSPLGPPQVRVSVLDTRGTPDVSAHLLPHHPNALFH